jgi:hypothetical protein
VKSDSPISKERGESHKEICGCRFPDREIEGPVSVLRAEEREDSVSRHACGCDCASIFLSTVASVTCHSQVSQTSNKAYFHDDNTKETFRIPQTLDLEEGE